MIMDVQKTLLPGRNVGSGGDQNPSIRPLVHRSQWGFVERGSGRGRSPGREGRNRRWGVVVVVGHAWCK